MTFCAKLAAHFQAHPREWVDGHVLMTLGGSFAFRTRISELRRAPWGMDIQNRVRRLENGVAITEYRYVPREPAKDLFEAADWSAAAQGERG